MFVCAPLCSLSQRIVLDGIPYRKCDEILSEPIIRVKSMLKDRQCDVIGVNGHIIAMASSEVHAILKRVSLKHLRLRPCHILPLGQTLRIPFGLVSKWVVMTRALRLAPPNVLVHCYNRRIMQLVLIIESEPLPIQKMRTNCILVKKVV